ncbi:MAG: phenyltransferase domain-containing protein, partial [Proteobacteria bacterium]|nr:phenyltransferase domain-containing protein [Pseudomonadota bacterium]
WAISPEGKIDPMALLTGSSSVYMSIKCALAIARQLGYDMPAWREGLMRLGDAIRHRPYNFNMSKSRYSMDWFYPILSGALTGEKAQNRVEKFWKKFVIKGQGVRCVSDRPWVTVAETCELSLTLAAMGNLDLAETVFSWIQKRTNPDGSYWCGFTCPDMTIWPEDKSTWTNAVVLIVADAIFDLTPGGRLFSHRFWKNFDFSS